MYSLKSIRNKTLEKKGSSFLVGYLLSGYKSCEDLLDVIKNLDSEGLDVFELGFPSDNPYADGKVIAAAHNKVNSERARSLEYWAKIRRITDRPIWVMAYCKDFIDTGIYKDFVKESLVDGLVIPDLDDNKRLALRDEVSSSNVDVIGFVNPGMEDSILDRELSNYSLIYEQLYVGQTGDTHKKEDFHHMIEYTLEKHPNTVPFAGFGINSKQTLCNAYENGFKGAVVGTELIKRLNNSKEELYAFIKEVQGVKNMKERN